MGVPGPQSGLLGSSLFAKALVGLLVLSALAHVLVTVQPPFMDEGYVVRDVLRCVMNKTIVASHTQYPSFYTYLIAPFVGAFCGALVATGVPPSVYDCSELAEIEPLYLLWPARMVTLLCWGGIVWLVYRISREVFDSRRAALLACIGMASVVGMLEYSGYALPDVPMALWATASLLYILRVSRGEHLERAALWAGILGGLAVATKYTGIAIVLPLMLGVWLAPEVGRRRRLGLSARALGGMALGFVVGCPGWVLAPGVYWEGLQAARVHMATGHLGYMGIPVLGQLELLLRADGLLVILAMVGVVAAIARLRKRALMTSVVILVSVVVSAVLVSAPAKKQSLHFLFMAYPSLAILAAVVFEIPGGAGAPLPTATALPNGRRLRVVGMAYLCGFAATTLAGLFWAFRVAVLPYSVDVAEKWMHVHVPADAVVAVESGWGAAPTMLSAQKLQRLRSGTQTHFVRNLYEALRGYESVPIEHEPDFLEATRATYLVTSSRCYDYFFVYGLTTRLPPPANLPIRDEWVRRKQFYSLLLGGEAAWRLEYEVYTGNGPTVRIFRK